MTTQLPHTMRELDSRTNDGLNVRLLWDPADGRVAVEVTDSKRGEELRFEVHQRERAREAFEHPFSYAAWLGIATPATRTELDAIAA